MLRDCDKGFEKHFLGLCSAYTESTEKTLNEGLNGLFIGHAVLHAKQCNLYKCKNWNIRLIIVIKTSIYHHQDLLFLHKKYIKSMKAKSKSGRKHTLEKAAAVHGA